MRRNNPIGREEIRQRKNLILLIAVLFVGACATTPTVQSVITSPSMKSIAGTYEWKKGKDTYWDVFLEPELGELNGRLEFYENGGNFAVSSWKIVNREIHYWSWRNLQKYGGFRINRDGSITKIAYIDGGIRIVHTKELQMHFKKIK